MPRETPAPGSFAPTRWSLVRRARGDDEGARRALEELCGAYWYPLYAWARREGLSPADAEDRVQGFFHAVLSRNLLERADAAQGRLRTFLLTVFRRFLRDEREKEGAQRRGGGQVISFDAAVGEEWFQEDPGSTGSGEAYFDRQWALTTLERAMERVETAYAKRGMAAEFEALRPFLTEGGDSDAYTRLGSSLGLTAGAFKVAVHRLRDRFREMLRQEVRETQAEEGEVEAEMRHLLEALRTAEAEV